MLEIDPIVDEIDGNLDSKTAGRWTAEEHQLFLKGLELYQRQWRLISDLVKTRTVVQIRTHAQKYFQKLQKNNESITGEFSLDKNNFDIDNVLYPGVEALNRAFSFGSTESIDSNGSMNNHGTSNSSSTDNESLDFDKKVTSLSPTSNNIKSTSVQLEKKRSRDNLKALKNNQISAKSPKKLIHQGPTSPRITTKKVGTLDINSKNVAHSPINYKDNKFLKPRPVANSFDSTCDSVITEKKYSEYIQEFPYMTFPYHLKHNNNSINSSNSSSATHLYHHQHHQDDDELVTQSQLDLNIINLLEKIDWNDDNISIEDHDSPYHHHINHSSINVIDINNPFPIRSGSPVTDSSSHSCCATTSYQDHGISSSNGSHNNSQNNLTSFYRGTTDIHLNTSTLLTTPALASSNDHRYINTFINQNISHNNIKNSNSNSNDESTIGSNAAIERILFSNMIHELKTKQQYNSLRNKTSSLEKFIPINNMPIKINPTIDLITTSHIGHNSFPDDLIDLDFDNLVTNTKDLIQPIDSFLKSSSPLLVVDHAIFDDDIHLDIDPINTPTVLIESFSSTILKPSDIFIPESTSQNIILPVRRRGRPRKIQHRKNNNHIPQNNNFENNTATSELSITPASMSPYLLGHSINIDSYKDDINNFDKDEILAIYDINHDSLIATNEGSTTLLARDELLHPQINKEYNSFDENILNISTNTTTANNNSNSNNDLATIETIKEEINEVDLNNNSITNHQEINSLSDTKLDMNILNNNQPPQIIEQQQNQLLKDNSLIKHINNNSNTNNNKNKEYFDVFNYDMLEEFA